MSNDSVRLMQCQTCKDIYNVPKLLNCLHSFCEECLHVTGNVIVCPICNHNTPVTDGTESLKTNQFLLKLTEKFASLRKSFGSGQSIVCTSCEDEEASFFYNDCRDFFCNECKDAHSRVRLTRTHLVFSISDIRSGQYDIGRVMRTASEECTRHDGETIRFFCKTCDYLISCDCLLCDNHLKGDYECICVRDVVSSCKKELNEALEGVRQKKKELVMASDLVESLLDDIERVVSEEESRVNLNAVQRIRAVEEEWERRLKFIRSKKSNHVKDLSAVLEQIDNGLRNVTDLTSFSNNLIELGQTTDIIVLKNAIITHANELAVSVCVPMIPSHLNDIAIPVVSDQEPARRVDRGTQLAQREPRVVKMKPSGTSMDNKEHNREKETANNQNNKGTVDKSQKHEVSIIEDNMCETIRTFVIDTVTKSFDEHVGCSDDIISSVKDTLELKFGPSWHVVTGTLSCNIKSLKLDYAVLTAGDQQIVVFCSGYATVSKQTLDRKVVVVETDMIKTMKRDAMRFSKQATSRYTDRSDVAKNIADVFRRKYGGKWQCSVIGKGSMIGLSKLSIATNSCIHFTIGQEILVLLKLSYKLILHII